jgi:uncharacterized protein YeaO (DUF488 family)
LGYDFAVGTVRIRRVYDEEALPDGYSVLVDRLWPRGIKKTELAVDEWAQDVAPTHELRRWYGHDPDRFEEFARRYRAQLRSRPAAEVVSRLRKRVAESDLTLLTATKDVERSAAAVLARRLSTK